MVTKQLNITNGTYCFYNDLINIKDFDPRLLKKDKKTSWHLLHWLCHKKTEYRINSVNPIYFMINRLNGFFEEKIGDKYLNIVSADGNSEVLRK